MSPGQVRLAAGAALAGPYAGFMLSSGYHPLTNRIVFRFFALFGALALATMVIAISGPAHAHSVLLGTDPDDEAQLASAPESVSLTFNEDITGLGTEIVITTGDGETVSDGTVEVKGPVITQQLVDARPAGSYEVTWRAVSSDGHPISGVFTFTAAEAVGGDSATTDAGPTNGGDDTAGEEPADDSTGAAESEPLDEADEADEAESASAQGEDTDDSGISTTTWVIIGVVVAAAIALAVILSQGFMKDRDKQDKDRDKQDPAP